MLQNLTARKVEFATTVRGGASFRVEIVRAWSPIGADRFYELVRNNYFDNSAFFRVVPGFVVQVWPACAAAQNPRPRAQFGLAADPQVTAQWKNRDIRDDPVKVSNKRGTMVFATSGPNTRTTQLFINLVRRGSRPAG
jgi:peptidyl-prolyl cis-trans isomerase A (cyclophilin A)